MRSLLVLCLPAFFACTTEPSSPQPSSTGPATHSATESGAPAGETETASSEETPADPAGTEASASEASADPVAGLRAHITEFSARTEHTDPVVTVQHLLVSFAGAGTGARRSQEEAEQLAGELFAQIQDGADFDALVKQHTDDSHPGIYTMTLGAPAAGQYQRRGMVPAFGNAGWRLAIGEIGVAGFEAGASPYGWHIVKRVEQ